MQAISHELVPLPEAYYYFDPSYDLYVRVDLPKCRWINLSDSDQ